jgi:hypothetical protein
MYVCCLKASNSKIRLILLTKYYARKCYIHFLINVIYTDLDEFIIVIGHLHDLISEISGFYKKMLKMIQKQISLF